MTQHPYLQRHTQRTRLLWLLVATCVIGAAILLATRPAGAHNPELHSKVVRPCGATAPWFGQVTVVSDDDYNKNWQNKHRIDGGSFTGYSPLVDDQVAYRVDVFNISAGVASVVVDTQSRWQNKSGSGGVVGPLDGSITLHRPAATECPNTGTTTTTTAPTTTTVPGSPPTTDLDTQVVDRESPAVPVPAAPTFTG